MLARSDRAVPADGQTLVLAALVCEQLWRRPRIALRELMHAISQVCAAEAASGRLPAFRVVAVDGVSKAEAASNRQHLLDALQLLLGRGLIVTDVSIDRVRGDDEADLVIGGDRNRLGIEFASLSPTLLRLSQRPVGTHARVLSARTLDETEPWPPMPSLVPATPGDGRRPQTENRADAAEGPPPAHSDQGDGVEGPDGRPPADRRGGHGWRPGASATSPWLGDADTAADRARRAVSAVRSVLDDPGLEPGASTPEGVMPYLETITGRERALTAAHSLGLAVAARRDWWQINDPTGRASTESFPVGRRCDRQAALTVLHALVAGTLAGPVTTAEIVVLLTGVVERVPRWAHSYQRSLPALAKAAAGQLVTAGLLRAAPEAADTWHPTPGVHLWRVTLAYAESGPEEGADLDPNPEQQSARGPADAVVTAGVTTRVPADSDTQTILEFS
jgi:hypothetical protein